MSVRWALGPGAVAAGRDMGPVTIMVGGGADDPLVAALPSRPLMANLARRLDLGRFTGREGLIRDIDATITGAGCGYVVVRAEAGVGKTALAASLVWSPQRPCAYHFTWLPGGRSPERARRGLAAQLILGWQLEDQLLAPGRQFPARADDPGWFAEVLHAVAARRDALYAGQASRPPVVLVVDGLDEADSAASGRDTGIPLGLPRPEHLPEGVFVLVTSRLGITLTGLRDTATGRPITVDGEDNLADMRSFLTEAVGGEYPDPKLCSALTAGAIDPGVFVKTLAKRCGGVWIYLRYVLDEIREGTRSPADVVTLPDGLVGYYLDQIHRWRSLTDSWDTTGLPLLATAVALRRPATRADLAESAGLPDTGPVRAWLGERLRPFLDVTRDDRNRPLYAVRHQSLRDLFEPVAGTDERDEPMRDTLHEALTAAHRRITSDLLHQVRDAPITSATSGYAREHLAAHATGAGLLDQLVLDPSFLLSCDEASLLRRRAAVTTSQAHAALNAYELSADRRHPEAARWWLHVWARKNRCDELAHRCAPTDTPTVARAFWAGLSHLRLVGHDGGVTAVCAVVLPDGRTLLVSAGFDGTVRLWDPSTGDPVGDPLTGHDGWVNAVCAVVLPDGRTLLASAGFDGTVRLWDPSTGDPVGDPLTGHDGWVNAVCAVVLPGGRTLLASAGNDRSVLLWTLPSCF